MRIKLLFSLMLMRCLIASAQSTNGQGYQQNIVKVWGEKSKSEESYYYGFITGEDKINHRTFFVIVTKGDAPRSPLRIMFDRPNDVGPDDKPTPVFASRYGEAQQIEIDNYRVYLYYFNHVGKYQRRYYDYPTDNRINNYFFSDIWMFDDDNFNADISGQPIERSTGSNEAEKLIYSSPNKIVPLVGMPVVNQSGVLNGLIASVNKKGSPITAINIMTIRDKLFRLSANVFKLPDLCFFFNLIRNGEELTYCEIEAKRRSSDSILQSNKTLRDEKARQLIRANSAKQDILIKRDRDYPLAITLGAAGTLNTISIANTESKTFTGYSYNLNLLINPDDDENPRYVFMPRYGNFKVGPAKPTNGGGVHWVNSRFRYVELPVLIEQFGQFEKADIFYGIGYSYGRQLDAKFVFADKNGLRREQDIIGNPISQHKAWGEIGLSYQKIRLAIFVNYQLSPMLRNDYELILDGVSHKPFENVKNRQWLFGIDLSYRLWGWWQKGYKVL